MVREIFMRNGFTVFLVLLSVTLAGCGTPKLKEGPPPPPTEVTPGSTFKLMKGFIVPSGDSSVFFQAGELYPDGNIQPNLPYCEFSVGAANADGVLLREGTFTVSEVTYDERDAGPGVDISVTGIHLQDALTGKTYQMDCMLPLLSTGALYVTPAEVQGAVADYMELKLAP
jgi:predicted small secreted protein